MQVTEQILNVTDVADIKIFPADYSKLKGSTVCGEISFQAHSNRSRHAIIAASRFNSNSMEENGPFPGWFLQIVGDRLSLGIGNGKKWTSAIHPVPIVDEKHYRVLFSIDNDRRVCVLNVNGEESVLENIQLKMPCRSVTIGALNVKGEFQFKGVVERVVVGGGIIAADEKVEADFDEGVVVASCDLLSRIENNMQNLSLDIESLNEIKTLMVSWTNRGLDLQVDKVENQMSSLERDRNEILEELANRFNMLKEIDDRIVRKGESVTPEGDKIVSIFKSCLISLVNDVKTLNDASRSLKQFKELGVKLGDAFITIEDQKDLICKGLIDTCDFLKKVEEKSKVLSNILRITDDLD